MNSPFSRGTLYLKRKNEDLLAQLESNSAILLERLNKLSNAAAAGAGSSSTQCAEQQQLTPLKRKHGYQSWLERNNSGQVSAVLNPGIFQNPTPSPVSNLDNVGLPKFQYEDEARTMPLAKRSRGNCQCGGRYSNTSTVAPLVTSRNRPRLTTNSKKQQQPRKRCPDCYCQAPKQQHNHDTHTNKKSGRICTGCSNYKIPHNSMANLDRPISQSNLDSRHSVLEEARSVISYSPESAFLKGLKERSQLNLNEPTLSSPKHDPPTIFTVDRQCRVCPRGYSRPTTKTPSFVVSNATDKSKNYRPTMKGPSYCARPFTATDKSKHCRPITKSPSFGVKKATDESDDSCRRNISNIPPKCGGQRDQSRSLPSQPIGNHSAPFRSTRDPAHKEDTGRPTDLSYKNIHVPISKTYKPPDDRPRSSKEISRPTTSNAILSASGVANKPKYSPTDYISRQALSRSRPVQSRYPTTSPPAMNTRLAATRMSKVSTHSSVSPSNHFKSAGKANTHGKSINTAKVKLRPSSHHVASGRASSKKTSPTISTTSSPSSSPTRKSSKEPTKSRDHLTCPFLRKENLRPITTKTPGNVKLNGGECHMSEARVRSLPSCCNAKENLENSPIATHCCKKYKNIYKPYCKTRSIKESGVPTTGVVPLKPFEKCYHEIGSPAELRSTFSKCKRCNRKSTRKHQLPDKRSCSYCFCDRKQPTDHDEPVAKTRSCDRGGPLEEEWVDELSRYRQYHWFDCHANPADQERTTRSTRVNNEFIHTHHDGVHRYMLNDRLFPTPLHPTCSCSSCCRPCCQPRNAEPMQPPKFRREITLSAMRNRDDVQVVLPQVSSSRPKSEERKTRPFKIYHDPDKNTRRGSKSTGCMLTHPIISKSLVPKILAPANSLALRYQKGIV